MMTRLQLPLEKGAFFKKKLSADKIYTAIILIKNMECIDCVNLALIDINDMYFG